jgi:hypothetical protein
MLRTNHDTSLAVSLPNPILSGGNSTEKNEKEKSDS